MLRRFSVMKRWWMTIALSIWTTSTSQTIMAVNRRYKLVLSQVDDPWLFDLHKDPDELVNVYSDPEYKEIAEKFKAELIAQMERYNEPALRKGQLIY